jgi:hypothetical protein
VKTRANSPCDAGVPLDSEALRQEDFGIPHAFEEKDAKQALRRIKFP